MQLKNINGVVIADFPKEALSLIEGITFDKVAGGEECAVVTDEAKFIESINAGIKEMQNAKAVEGTLEDIKKGYDAGIAKSEKLLADLKLVPVYDGDAMIDSALPDDIGHINYEPVKDSNGVVTHFNLVEVKPDKEVTYPVYDYKDQRIKFITEAEAQLDDLLEPVLEDGKLKHFTKQPEYLFNVTAVIGIVRITGAKNKEEAFEMLKEIELGAYINRDNTKLSYIQ